MDFTKMHGLGNDYLYVYGEVPENVAELSIKLSDRHFGVGSDGMIFICPSNKADFLMRIFNADGSEAKMCGNGIRCVGKYVYEKGYTEKTELLVDTLSGIKHLTLLTDNGCVKKVRVNMGFGEAKADLYLSEDLICTPVSVGNPHAVFFVPDAEAVPLETIGPEIEHHQYFPDGVNVEFVQILGEHSMRMRVWERGSGITMACGTGACASAFAAVQKGFFPVGETIQVILDGGTLEICVQEDGEIKMTGPAEFVCDGTYPAQVVRGE